MVCKREEQCVFGEECIFHVGTVLPKCSIFEQKPPIKQTEQEWLQTCNTEQLAEWIVSTNRCKTDHLCSVCRQKWCDKKFVVEWLKQPHEGD